MTYPRSFSPNGIPDPNPAYMMCNGAFHATMAAKMYSIYLFLACLLVAALNFWAFGFDKTWFSILCVAGTVFYVLTIYAVFLENRHFLVFFLLIQGVSAVFTVIGTITYVGFGIFTDFIADHHKNMQPIRDIYHMHGLNPDHELTQTITTTSILFFMILSSGVQCYGWYVMLQAYKCFKENDRTIVPNNGYHKGIIADNTNEDYE